MFAHDLRTTKEYLPSRSRRAATGSLVLGAVAAVLLVPLGFLRLHILDVACAALMLAVLVSSRPRLLPRLTGAIALPGVHPDRLRDGPRRRLVRQEQPRSERATRAGRGRGRQGAFAAGTAPPEEPPLEGAPPDAAADDMSAVGTSLRYLPKGVTILALRPCRWRRRARASVSGPPAPRRYSSTRYSASRPVERRAACSRLPVLASGATLVMYGLI